MKRAVDAAVFIYTFVVFWPGIFPPGFQFLQRNFVGSIAVNLVGAQKNENRLGTMEARGFEKIHGAQRVDFKIENRDIAGLIVRRLPGPVHDQVETLRTEERLEGSAVPDVDLVVLEVLRDTPQPIEIPAGVTGITEKDLAHVVIDTVDLMALAVEIFHGFRTDEPTGTGNQNCIWLHLESLLPHRDWAGNQYYASDSANLYP